MLSIARPGATGVLVRHHEGSPGSVRSLRDVRYAQRPVVAEPTERVVAEHDTAATTVIETPRRTPVAP